MADNNAIATKSAKFRLQDEFLCLPRNLLGGTRAMRKTKEEYLRKGEAEHQADYDLRLESTFLIDSYARTLNFLTGQVFKKDIVLEDETSEVAALSDDIDGQGNNLSVFCQKLFRSGLNDGSSYVLVDFSRVTTKPSTRGLEYKDSFGEWLPYTREAIKRNGFRPRWVHIEASQVIEIRKKDGRIDHFRYLEEVETPGNTRWGKKTVKKIRVFEPGTWEIWQQADENSDWILEQKGEMSTREIPIAAFRPGEPLSEFTAMPALQGLAELCVEHWQASSGHRHLMDWVRRPAFFGKLLGQDEGKAVEFGPNRLIMADDPSADLRSVGVDPSSVSASSADLEKIESKMAAYGLRLLLPRTGGITATQNALESAESDSTLKRWANQFKDTVELALRYTAHWLDEDKEAGIRLNDEFVKVFDAQLFGTLLQAEQSGVIPKKLVYDAIRSLLPVQDDIDWQEAKALIGDQQRIGPEQPAAQDIAKRFLSSKPQGGLPVA